MSDVNTNRLLNKLVAMHNRSLATYMRYASPTWDCGDGAAKETLRLMVEDQRDTAERIAAMVTENNGVVDNGEYPMYYTGYHDLSFDFLLNEIIKEHTADIAEIEQIADELRMVPLAKAAADEALGAAKGHLESLNELKASASNA